MPRSRPSSIVLAILAFTLIVSHRSGADEPAGSFVNQEIEPQIDEDLQRRVRAAVADIRSGSFTARERASTELYSMGIQTVPLLRKIAGEQPDREVDVRLRHLIRKLTAANLESLLARLVAGEEVDVEGWRWFRLTMGSSKQSREMFAKMMTAYPESTAALAGGSRDRGEALRNVSERIRQARFERGVLPTSVDVMITLLPLGDPQVPVDEKTDSAVITVLTAEGAEELSRDRILSPGFKRLVASWINRSTPAALEAALSIGLRLQVPNVMQLANDVLQRHAMTVKTIGPEALDALQQNLGLPPGAIPGQPNAAVSLSAVSLSMQIASVYGDNRTLDDLKIILDDPRFITGINNDQRGRTQTTIGDAAAVTVLLILKSDPTEFGLANLRSDPRYGFFPQQIGFPLDGSGRVVMHNQVRSLLEAAD